MSIKSGQRYKITNEENGRVFDAWPMLYWDSGQADLRKVWRKKQVLIGQDFHGSDNQQVRGHLYLDSLSLTQPQYAPVNHKAAGRRSMDYSLHQGQKYVRFENTPDNRTAFVVIDKPQLWDIEILSESEDHDNPRVNYV
jgi:hypothetical protein